MPPQAHRLLLCLGLGDRAERQWHDYCTLLGEWCTPHGLRLARLVPGGVHVEVRLPAYCTYAGVVPQWLRECVVGERYGDSDDNPAMTLFSYLFALSASALRGLSGWWRPLGTDVPWGRGGVSVGV